MIVELLSTLVGLGILATLLILILQAVFRAEKALPEAASNIKESVSDVKSDTKLIKEKLNTQAKRLDEIYSKVDSVKDLMPKYTQSSRDSDLRHMYADRRAIKRPDASSIEILSLARTEPEKYTPMPAREANTHDTSR